jgi:transketolase
MAHELEFSDVIFDNRKRTPDELAKISRQLREDIIKTLLIAQSGHTGGPLGIADVMATLFFGGFMNYKSNEPDWLMRDRFVLSAGHMTPILYSVLARAGYFEVEKLKTFRKLNSQLQGHPGLDVGLPGIETASGSLGQGVSIAVGMAMSDMMLDQNHRKVFAVTGDGELQEGTVWEAAMTAGNYCLENFCWIIDNNNCQIDGYVRDVMNVNPLYEKFRAFNFDVIEINGHNFKQINKALTKFHQNHYNGIAKPTCIIAKTTMGKGVSFMEGLYQWHGIPPTEDNAKAALKELGVKLK